MKVFRYDPVYFNLIHQPDILDDLNLRIFANSQLTGYDLDLEEQLYRMQGILDELAPKQEISSGNR